MARNFAYSGWSTISSYMSKFGKVVVSEQAVDLEVLKWYNTAELTIVFHSS